MKLDGIEIEGLAECSLQRIMVPQAPTSLGFGFTLTAWAAVKILRAQMSTSNAIAIANRIPTITVTAAGGGGYSIATATPSTSSQTPVCHWGLQIPFGTDAQGSLYAPLPDSPVLNPILLLPTIQNFQAGDSIGFVEVIFLGWRKFR